MAGNCLEVCHGHFLLIEEAGSGCGRGRAGSVSEEGRGLRPAGRRGGASGARQEGGGTARPSGLGDVEEGQDPRSVFNNVGFYNSWFCSMNSEIGKLKRKVILVPELLGWAGLGWSGLMLIFNPLNRTFLTKKQGTLFAHFYWQSRSFPHDQTFVWPNLSQRVCLVFPVVSTSRINIFQFPRRWNKQVVSSLCSGSWQVYKC